MGKRPHSNSTCSPRATRQRLPQDSPATELSVEPSTGNDPRSSPSSSDSESSSSNGTKSSSSAASDSPSQIMGIASSAPGSDDGDPSSPSSSAVEESGPVASAAVEHIVSLMQQLERSDMDRLMLCTPVQTHYQIRPIVRLRRNGKVEQAVGPPLRRPSTAPFSYDQDTLEGPHPRPRIQSDKRIVESGSEDEGGVETTGAASGREDSVEPELDRSQSTPREVSRQIAHDEEIDQVPELPSTAVQESLALPHEWDETAASKLPALDLLRRHHPLNHRALRQALRGYGNRATALGNQICTLGEALAGPHSVREVVMDLRGTLQDREEERGRIVCTPASSVVPVGASGTPSVEDTQGSSPVTVSGRELMVIPSTPTTATATAQHLAALLHGHTAPDLYRQIQALDASRYAHALMLRVHLANLARLFEEMRDGQPSSSTKAGPWHKSQVSAAKDTLFTQVVVGADRRDRAWVTEARRFERRLNQGRRWWAFAQRFGWGALIMVPGGFPESRWEREMGSDALVEIFFGYLEKRYPQWVHADRAMQLLVGLLSRRAPVNVPEELGQLEQWLQGA